MRTKSDAQKYLERVELIDTIVKNKLIEQLQWRDLAESITANMGGERVQSSGSMSRMADAVNKCIDMEGQIACEVDKLAAEKQEITATIEQMDNPTWYNLLHMRYIQFKSLQEIADHYGKEYDWATTTHGRAIQSLQSILDREEINR